MTTSELAWSRIWVSESHFSTSISSGSEVLSLMGSRRSLLLLRWSVTFARRVRIFRSSSAMGPCLVTMLGCTLTAGLARVSCARFKTDV